MVDILARENNESSTRRVEEITISELAIIMM